MKTIFIWYVAISCILAIAEGLYLGGYDLYTIYINPSKKDSKFGYNFGRTGLGWYLVSAFLPGVNLAVIAGVLILKYDDYQSRKKAKLSTSQR